MNETTMVLIAYTRILLYQFVAMSLVFLALSYQNWPKRAVAWMHIIAASIFSILGFVAFMDATGRIELSALTRGLILTPLLLIIGVSSWAWLIRRERERIKRAEEGGTILGQSVVSISAPEDAQGNK